MKFFSGFCVNLDKDFFSEYIEYNEFVVAGFSYGAQKALDYVLNASHRVDKLQLLSPAFFDYNKKLIELNKKAFKENKELYIKNFLYKAGIKEIEKVKTDCFEEDLIKLFTFDWTKIEKINNIKIEVFLGEFDKIIALKKAYKFFKNYADVYFIKKANHFLKELD